jgi:hypothetical protein
MTSEAFTFSQPLLKGKHNFSRITSLLTIKTHIRNTIGLHHDALMKRLLHFVSPF